MQKLTVVVNGYPLDLEVHERTQLKHICGHALFSMKYDYLDSKAWEVKDSDGNILDDGLCFGEVKLPPRKNGSLIFMVLKAGVGA